MKLHDDDEVIFDPLVLRRLRTASTEKNIESNFEYILGHFFFVDQAHISSSQAGLRLLRIRL